MQLAYVYVLAVVKKETYVRAIPKVSGLDVMDNNNFYNLYISETYILYKL